jgi:Na+-transporting NADH:ubiquinone oxidoreductase subunit B
MQFLRDKHDQIAPLFEKGGKLEKLYPVWEAHDTLLFTPGEVTKGKTHVRDALDLKRMMIMVVVALLPCIAMALYNTGYQANSAIASGQATPLDSWQTAIFAWLFGNDFTPTLFSNLIHGALYFVPVSITTLAVGGIIEVVFAVVRNHEVNEGFLVTWALLPLTLPPTIPLWQVAMGIAFGVIFAKEVFGGTGMNILNVALTARAFLFFAYPAQISGAEPWIAADFLDGNSGATLLASAAEGVPFFDGADAGSLFTSAFLGFIPGSMGETSTLACLMGAGILILTQVGSWRTMAGVVLGTVAMGYGLNAIGSDTNAMFNMPFYWHFVLGGWAFGMVFMATDPVTSSFTEKGKWIYGIGIGVMVVLVRVVNPAYPEGMMLAILFMNMFAPFIDHFVVQANVKRRLARHGS